MILLDTARACSRVTPDSNSRYPYQPVDFPSHAVGPAETAFSPTPMTFRISVSVNRNHGAISAPVPGHAH